MLIGDIVDIIYQSMQIGLSYLISPGKRVYLLYLFSSLLLAYFVYRKSKLKVSFFSYIFKKEVWLGKSPFIDYSLLFFNSMIKVLIIAPFLIYSLYIAEYINEYLIAHYGILQLEWSATFFVILYTITIIIVNDFASFIIHYFMHKVPFLWEFHKVHHAATVLNPFTQYRVHPIELIINNIRGIIIKGTITGLFLYLADGKVSLLTFLGINVLNFVFLFFGANLRHSHVKLKYFDFLEYILISPYQHQIHHSNSDKHYDTNMGSRLAIWDYLFGTLIRSKSINKIDFGLGKEDKNYATFSQNLLYPFIRIFKK